MSKLKGKLARRIMAIVLSGAMVMSNMSAYAAELSTETTTEAVSEVEETAAAEPSAEPAKEEEAASSDENKAETKEAETSVAESSESKADEENSEAATSKETTEAKTENTTESESNTETEVASMEEETSDVAETETTEESATVEETTKTEEDNKEGEIDKTTNELSIDLSGGLDVNTLYGNKELLTFTVLEAMAANNDTYTTDKGVEYSTAVQGKNNPKDNGSNSKGTIPTSGAAFKITTTDTPSTITFVLKGTNKDTSSYYLVKDESGTAKIANTGNAKDTQVLDFELEINSTYYFYVGAGKARVYGISYKKTGSGSGDNAETPVTTTFDTKELFTATISQGSMAGQSVSYVNDYFTVLYGEKTSVDSHKQTFDDGYESAYRINFRGVASTTSNAIKFTTTQDEATIKIWWRPNDNGRHIVILNENGESVFTSADQEKSINYIEKAKLTSKGTYYIGGDNASNIYIYKVVVTDGHTEEAVDWKEVAAPEVLSAEQVKDENGKLTNKIDVKVKAVIDELKGCEELSVEMYNSADELVSTLSTKKAAETDTTLQFTVDASGSYSFIAKASRTNEEPKPSSKFAMATPFVLPLTKPHIKSATSKGKTGDSGSVEVAWDEVKEATGYIISYKQDGAADDTAKSVEVAADKLECVVKEGLEIGKTYLFTLTAKRAGTGAEGADELSEVSDATPVEITAEAQVTWAFSTYGDSTSTSKNGYTDKAHVGKYNGKDMPLAEVNWTDGANPVTTEDDGDFVRVWSMGGSGKVVPANVDGLSFYYTEINPDTTNFKLTATAHVNELAVSNGQDGFGIMAADRVGTHGDAGKWWNNSYQALASKIEYRWNPDKAIPDYSGNTEYPRYSMKLGIGSTEKLGVTKENVGELTNAETTVEATKKYFKTDTKTLDTSTIKLPGGTYNIIGNYSGAAPEGTQKDLLVTDLKFSIELNATGYFLSYTPVYADGKEGTTITNKYYGRKALSHIEEDTVYIGFFSSRNADVTFKDVTLETRDFDPDEIPESRPVEKILPAYSVSSGSTANSEDYSLLFSANWPGKLTVKDNMGNTVIEPKKDAEGKVELNNVVADENGIIDTFKSDPVKLNIGVNTFQWTFTPDEDYVYDPNPNYDGINPSEPRSFTELSDYATQTGTFTVTYKKYGNEGDALYVSPKGTSAGTGTKANPLDIYTAVKYVQSGQTIYLMEGTYKLSKTVTVGRGISGTVDVEYETDADGNIIYDNYDFKKVKSHDVKEYIYMVPEPNAGSRPVLDFGRVCEGLVVAGDAWYIKGIDITNSQLSKDGMRVCGSYNVVEDVHTYKNGNTGLQISRFGSDTKDYWPSYNLILNCTSYLNADQGFEDADGFAAKLTIGQGNVFDGCIAAYNADDGWDLFAKVESGNIGKVVIKNSIAYRNGYVLIKDKDGDGKITNAEARDQHRILDLKDGIEYPAGNGNGFKMGGSNLPGGHSLYNSAAFYNAAKGIDSNSCPDIKAYNSVSFNNEGSNVAFYGTITNSDFASEGVISYRTDEPYDVWKKTDDGTMVKNGTASYADVSENLKPSGTQSKDPSAFKNETSYFWDSTTKTSKNTKDIAVSADWFVKADNASFLEFENAMKADMDYARVNGKINLHGFLELTDKVGTAAGEGNTGLGGAPSDEKEKLPEIPSDVPPTEGDISSGDAGEETEGNGVRPEDMEQYLENVKNGVSVGDLWFSIVDSDDVYYTGKAVRPEVHVYDGTTLLTKKDYTIKYKNNVNAYEKDNHDYKNADKPTIIIKGVGNYENQATEKYFDIHPVDFGIPEGSSKPYIVVRDIAVEEGKTGKVTPVVTYNGKKLSAGRDYKNITVAPTKTTEITLEAVAGGNYTGSTTFMYTVASKDKLAKYFKISSIPEQQRNGYVNNDVKQPIPVTLEDIADKQFSVQDRNGKKLTYGKDYTIRYENNVEVGTAIAIFVGMGDYAGTQDKKFKIYAPNISTLLKENRIKISENGKDITNVDMLAAETFKGAEIKKGGVKVTDTTRGTLDIDKDYVVVYKNNRKAGTASIVIKGIGNYSGSITKRFKINPLDLNALPKDVSIEGTFEKDHVVTANYAKGGSKPNVEIIICVENANGKPTRNKLIQGKDFSVSYKNNTVCGKNQGILQVKGKGGIKGTLIKDFTIVGKDLSDPDIVITAEDVTVPSASKETKRTPKIVVKDANGKKLALKTDYTVSYELKDGNGSVKSDGKNGMVVSIKKESDILTVKATIKASKNAKSGYTGETTTEFRVGYAKQSLAKARAQVLKQFDYTGEAIKLNQNEVTNDIEVILNGKKLKYGEDFAIMTTPDYKVDTYKNNVKVGTASVTIVGIGDYTGTKEVKYKITAKNFKWWSNIAEQLVNSL